MKRLTAALALALLAGALPAAADDLPPWMQPAPQPSGATGAPAPEATPGAEADTAAFGEIVGVLLSPELARKLRDAPADKRAGVVAAIWNSDLAPHQRAQVHYASEKLRENGQLATARATALLVLGPPQARHSEPARTWGGETVERIDDLGVVKQRLRGERAKADALTVVLTGDRPTEVWVYPGPTLNDLRTVIFVDDDSDGTFRLVRDAVVPASSPISTAPAVEPPPELFPPAAAVAIAEALPGLAKDGLPIAHRQDFFKASAGRTFARFSLILDPDDVELELDGDPAAFGAAAEAWLRVEQGGTPAWQGRAKLAEVNALASDPWLLELSVPLLPGKYQVTAMVLDAAKAGGRETWEVDVPSYSGGLALSSALVARAVDGTLPKAPAGEDGSLAPFQVGNYIVRPSAAGAFKRGDSIAFVVQAYNAPAATIEYALYADGVYQSSLDAVEIKSLPSTQIILQDLTEAFRDGSYELRITLTNPKAPAEKAKASVPFRVRG